MNLQPLVLALLEGGPLYGYLIAQRARKKAGLKWEEGTLYPLLHKMERGGLVRSEWREAPGERRRKYYALTRSGHAALAGARTDWREQVKAVSRILLGGRHADAR
ncbi:MAG: hypothetical protein FD180_3356 [Planctomycetota bacterium]|nr:MAG: hypothetical protein FD180_3356 [Planctomycetota bacterium]